MAIQKALFTSQADFTQQKGIGINVDPFLSYDADDRTGWNITGTPGKVPGMKGNAETYATAFAQRDMILRPGRHIFSYWMRPTTADMTDWRIFYTNRGAGQTGDRGFHVAMLAGNLNARVHSDTGAMTSIYGFEMTGNRIQANNIYHILFIYDTYGANTMELWVNNITEGSGWVRWAHSQFPITISSGVTRKLSIGDMPSGSATQYPFNGWMDEFQYWTDAHGGQVPTLAEIQTTYHDHIMNANWIDWWTEPGSMILGSNVAKGYTNQAQVWNSPTIDIGPDGFGDFGRVQINYEAPPNTGINMFTRSSTNGSNWNNWTKVHETGQINSPDQRYLQIRVEFYSIDPSATPKIMEIQVLDYETKKRLSLIKEPLIVYRDLNTGLERMGELVNAYDIYITEEINGEETLEFKLAMNDPKRKELGAEPVEMIAQIGDKRFIIRNPIDTLDSSGKKSTQFFAESLWYELRDAMVVHIESVEDTAFNTIQKVLDASIEPTGWTLYKAEPTIRRTIRGEWKTVLELLHEIRDQFGGELQFDTVDRTISLVNKIGENNGIRFYYNKNLKSIERSVDTFGLVTRLYVYGKNDMTIRSVNDNVEYLQNTKWVDALKLRNRIRIAKWADGRYTIPQNLKDDGQAMLDEASKPNIIYAMEVNDLSMLSGHEHESIGLGDTVFTVDSELLNLLVESRIMRRRYNVRQPWKTEVELNQPKKELADANRRHLDDAIELLAESDPLDITDVQQMTVFNHLLNSRAEDGTAYWEETGTGIEPGIGGFSGNASWKVTGGYGQTNILKQSIFGVSHRSAYTVSAYVYNEGTITRGPTEDAFVGIRVRVHYTEPDRDGKTYEDHYLAIPDITQEGGDDDDGSEFI